MKTILIFISAFIASSLLNSFLTSCVHDNIEFADDLVDPRSVIIRIVIALVITQAALRAINKRTKT